MNTYASHIDVENFEQLYIRLRQQEGRVYSDAEVARLPLINTGHPHYKEWVIRRQSCKSLLSYIRHKDTVLKILEIGCGNGWLSAQLAGITNASVTGLDINQVELEQAERVFANLPNLKFLRGSIADDFLKDEKFDLIIFAACVQYFPSLKQVMNISVEHLTLQGEVHIMDSHFYQLAEIAAARQRSLEYYKSIGVSEMARHYYHHSFNELDSFQYKILHHPHAWKNKLSIKRNPFFWISIKNRYS